jgi:hypothetical protein
MAKKGLFEGYATYSPEIEGYGNSQQWKESFRHKMGLGEAKETSFLVLWCV